MTTQEKFDLIPAHYLPKFINDDKTLIALQIPHHVGIDIEKATVKKRQGSVEICINGTSLNLSTTMNSVTINIL
jgi:hypothetical protein